MTLSNPPAVWWIRRDLRLTDNQALAAALEKSNQLLPVFILDPGLLSSRYIGPKRLAFLFAGLRELDRELRERGGRLIVRQGSPVEQLSILLEESKAEAIYAEADYSPYARKRDASILSALPLTLTEGVVVHPPGSVLKRDGDPYTVFTPFSKAWKEIPPPGSGALLPAPDQIETPDHITTRPIPDEPVLNEDALFRPGSEQGRAYLNHFISGKKPPIYEYGRQGNVLDPAGTSRLSPYLRFGMISARQAVVAALAAMAEAPDKEALNGADTWLTELIWREFYVHILYHFPQVRGQSFRPSYDKIQWANSEADFQAWCKGQTGYPIVDASMRQLHQQGWLPNRARMIVASFLVKDLLIDWRWGEKWFMQCLVDDYPAPIINHAAARDRTLAAFKAANLPAPGLYPAASGIGRTPKSSRSKTPPPT